MTSLDQLSMVHNLSPHPYIDISSQFDSDLCVYVCVCVFFFFRLCVFSFNIYVYHDPFSFPLFSDLILVFYLIEPLNKGSGADNFYDAGSCIDGRLTSAWNWCNQLPEKPYFVVFKLTGFSGFDGQFEG